MNDRPSFSPCLMALAVCLNLLALTIRSSPYRRILFLPTASIYCYLAFRTTTGDAAGDIGLGNNMMSLLLFAVDYILLTDVQSELRLKSQTSSISSAGFLDRLWWAVRLFLTPRGIGWVHASSSLRYPQKPSSRTRFVSAKLLEAFACVLLERAISIINHFNPALQDTEARSARHYGFYYQTTGVLGYALTVYSGVNVVFCMTSSLSVLFGISESKDWPDVFGKVGDAYSVQRVWR